MNNRYIHDITVRLSQALNQNYDVVNMEEVTAVIGALEGTTITKEQLETTRLAKYINQLRRRTKDEILARRAKSLLKKWREMVGIQQQQQQHQQIEDGILHSNNSDNHIHASTMTMMTALSPVLLTPVTQSANNNNINIVHNINCNSGSSYNNNGSNNMLNIRDLKRLSVENTTSTTAAFLDSDGGKNNAVLMLSSISNAKQPTSFANFLRNFNSGKNNVSKPVMETFIIDQSSNSNSSSNIIGSGSVNIAATSKAPVIIDIQDSNSGSNVISAPPDPPAASIQTTDFAPITMSPYSYNKASSSSVAPAASVRKPRKEKKRKERGEQSPPFSATAPPPLNSNNSNAYFYNLIDEATSSSNNHQQQQQYQKPKCDTPVDVLAAANSNSNIIILDDIHCDKLHDVSVANTSTYNNYQQTTTISNISEILSLSNSSMSSMFPTEAGSDTATATHLLMEQQYKQQQSKSKTHIGDLTFSGKFQQLNSSIHTIINNTSAVVTTATTVTSTSTILKSTMTTAAAIRSSKFHQFGGVVADSSNNYSNSNESNSNSHHSLPATITAQKHYDSIVINEQQQKQQQQSATTANAANDVRSNASAVAVEKKIPKKRGRKKGSRGVDSVIAKETSLSSQMLLKTIGSGGKKVKTTKELYAEMQNRKLQQQQHGVIPAATSPLTHWVTQQQQQSLIISRPESSCSDLSLHSTHTLDAYSSTNATNTMSTMLTTTRSTPEKYLTTFSGIGGGGSGTITNPDALIRIVDSDTVMSEPSRDSCVRFDGTTAKVFTKAVSTDSNSNSVPSQLHSVDDMQQEYDVAIRMIQNQLSDLIHHLEAVQTIEQIERECSAELTPCTCRVIEQLPNKFQVHKVVEVEGKKKEESDGTNLNIKQEEVQKPKFKNADLALTKTVGQPPLVEASIPFKPKKSIFDLDFDDDEDPLHTIIAEVAAPTKNSTAANQTLPSSSSSPENGIDNIKLEFNTNDAVEMQQTLMLPPLPPIPSLPLPIFPTYGIEEDSECVAKLRFEMQTQKITEFHVNALHNCYIPNVNGNWDQSSTAVDMDRNDENEDVVPNYGTFVAKEPRIRKNLSHIRFKKYMKSSTNCKLYDNYQFPFLGVAYGFIERCNKQKYGNRKIIRKRFGHCSRHHHHKILGVDSTSEAERQTEMELNMTTAAALAFTIASLPSLRDTITIDVDDNSTATLTTATPLSLKPQNLLTIVGDVILNDGDENVAKAMMMEPTQGTLIESEHYNNICNEISAAEAAPNQVSSRRSSSCSNSSLKQTQQSINLKLRQQCILRKQQKEKASKRLHKELRNLDGAEDGTCVIKRKKIAISGDVAKQRDVCFNDDDNDQSVNSDNSNISYDDADIDNSQYYDDEEQIGQAKYHDDIDATDKVSNTDYYEDKEDGEEDEEVHDEADDGDGGGGYHHEVVLTCDSNTSEISGNNHHILLKIKKTPSKTNSPNSNSMSSSISPITIAKSTPTIPTTAATILVTGNVEDMHKFDAVTPFGAEQTASESLTFCETASDTIINHDTKENTSPNSTVVDAASSSPLPLDNEGAIKINIHKRQKKTSYVKKLRTFQFPNHSSNTKGKKSLSTRKLHNQLFFPHELHVRRIDGVVENLLNISSCSSNSSGSSSYNSCTEEEEKYNSCNSSLISLCYEGRTVQKRKRNDSKGVGIQYSSTAATGVVCDAISCTSCCSASDDDVIDNYDRGVIDNYDDPLDNQFLTIKPHEDYVKKQRQQQQQLEINRYTSNGYRSNDIITTSIDVGENQIAATTNIEIGAVVNDVNVVEQENLKDFQQQQLVGIPITEETIAEKYSKKEKLLKVELDLELPLENNGILLSFNRIDYPCCSCSEDDDNAIANASTTGTTVISTPITNNARLSPSLVMKNCDYSYNNNNNNNNNNLNLIMAESQEQNMYVINDNGHVNMNIIDSNSMMLSTMTMTNCNDIHNHNDDDLNSLSIVHNDHPLSNNDDRIELINCRQQHQRQPQKQNVVIATNSQQQHQHQRHCHQYKQQMEQEQHSTSPSTKDYLTGLRTITADTAVSSSSTKQQQQQQQFKEWHEVLQLRSYNNELLTVLPYVVLE